MKTQVWKLAPEGEIPLNYKIWLTEVANPRSKVMLKAEA